MKFSLHACARFLAVQAFLFVFAAVFAVEINAQQSNKNQVKPQAILVAEWSEPDRDLNAEALPVRSLVRAKVATKPNFNSAVSTPNSLSALAVHSKSAARFAHLQPTELEQKAFDLINEQRALQNLSALEWDLGMLQVAREHSQNMAKHKFFSHAGIDGKTADNRADANGITDWRAIGENIAFNQGVPDKAEFAVKCWLRSPKHKENLLGKRWTRSGVGVAVTSDGKFYVTQVFRN